MREHVTRSGIARSEIRADQPVVDELGLHHRRRNVAFHQLRRRAAQQRLRLGIEAIEARLFIRERIEERARLAFGALAVGVEAGDVALVERRDLARIALAIGAEQQRAAVEQRRERVRIFAIERNPRARDRVRRRATGRADCRRTTPSRACSRAKYRSR